MFIVYYTGVGANYDGIHTFKRFLDVGRRVGFYREGPTHFESVILSAIEAGAIVYKIESTDFGLRLRRFIN